MFELIKAARLGSPVYATPNHHRAQNPPFGFAPIAVVQATFIHSRKRTKGGRLPETLAGLHLVAFSALLLRRAADFAQVRYNL